MRLTHAVAACLALALVSSGCVAVTFAHPIGFHYIEFEGTFRAAEIAEGVRTTLAASGATDITVEFLRPREEDPRAIVAHVNYTTTQNQTTYHHGVHINCTALCWFSGAEGCASQRCAISGGANEQTLGAEYVKALLAALQQALRVPTDTRGPPRTEIEPPD